MNTLPRLVVLGLALLASPGSAALAQQQKNPLSRKAVADPFARTFTGGELALTLKAEADGYAGTLTVGGSEFPVRARRADAGLRGSFTVEGEEFAFTCKLDGDRLELESDGERYELHAQPAPPAPADAGATVASPLPELVGVYQGAVTPLQHPDGYFRCDMPRGWSVEGQTEGALLVNPGLQETDTLEGLVFITYGELEERDRGTDIAQLLTLREPEMRADLEAQGLTLTKPAKPARKVAVGERAGAELEWRGQGANGGVTVWCGALVEREYYLAVVALVMEGKEAQYVPGAKRMFRSLEPKAPEPNPRLERGLAGATFGKSTSFGDSGSMTTTYAFSSDGTVRRETLVSGPTPTGDIGGDVETAGRFRAVGKLVYMQFRDGQEVARYEGPEEKPTGLRFGESLYPRL
jgi:hypothetical protein